MKNYNKFILALVLFLGFGWLGASKTSNESLSTEKAESLISNALNWNYQTANSQDFTLGHLLIQLGVGYNVPAAADLKLKSSVLFQEIKTYCDTMIEGGHSMLTDEENIEVINNLHEKAQMAWVDTMKSYHRMVAAPYGPIYDNSKVILNHLYSWPLMNECGMHTEMIQIKETGDFDPKALYTSKGLMAVEFGLFKDLNSTTCNARNPRFKKVHDWLTLDETQKSKDMCGLALKAAESVQIYANQLDEAWRLDSGNATKNLVSGSEFESFQVVLNKITDGLFTTIEVSKDTQLGKPLGLHKDCLNADRKCTDDIEHKWSQTSFEAIEQQFLGLKQVFNEGGLGTYLKSKGFDDIYQKIIAQTDVILNHIDEVKKLGNFKQQISDMDSKSCEATTENNNLVPVCGVQRQIRVLVHTFKSEFFPALSLNAPLVYQGDAD